MTSRISANDHLVKCGRNVTTRPHYHITTNDIRSCYNGQPTQAFDRDGTFLGTTNTAHNEPSATPTPYAGHPAHPATTPTHTSATPSPTSRPTGRPTAHKEVSLKQAKYYTDLTTALGLPNLLNRFDGWSISPELNRLKALRDAKPTSPTTTLPADPNNGNDLRAPSFRAPFTPVDDGVYLYQGTYFKVITAVESGRRYAKRFDTQTKKFNRAPGKIRELTPDMVVSPEQAAQFGKLYGICCFCSRTLTDERSIGVGYGPRCAERYGLPWG